MSKDTEKNQTVFFFLLVFILVVIGIIVYISATSPSKEEFVEVYWQQNGVKNLRYTYDGNCKILNCSKSGIFKIGNVNLYKKIFGIIITDLEKSGEYDALCIDFNDDGIFCDYGEGPFRERDSFLIDSDAFSVLSLTEKNIIFVHYPREVYVQNFTIGFVINSHYSDVKYFNVSLFINESLENSKTLKIESNKQVLSHFEVSLPSKGLFKVEVSVSPLKTDEKAIIDFWVERK